MIVGRVIGTVVGTWKEPHLEGQKLLMVQDLHQIGTEEIVVAVDSVGSGVGDTVLVVIEGGAARQSINSTEAPINASIVGFVDHVDGYEKGED